MSHRLASVSTALAIALGITGPTLDAQPTITPLVLEGDAVAGVGNVTSISHLDVNNDGTWLVEVDTDQPNADLDAALLRDGVLVLREGDGLPAPAGATLDGFDSNSLNNSGQIGFNFFLDGTAAGEDSGIHAYLDTSTTPLVSTVLVLQEGEDAPGAPPGSPVLGYFDVKLNDAEQLLAVVSYDDPAIPSGVDRGLFVLTTDAMTGGVSNGELIAAEGDVLLGQTSGLTDFGTGPHESDLNNLGAMLFSADIPDGDAIYRYDGDFIEIAQVGDPSPVAGRAWANLTTSNALDLSNNDHHVYRGLLDGDTGSNTLIVKDSAAFIQEGGSLPAIGGVFTFESFGTGPVLIDDGGNVVWYGEWNDPDGDIDSGLFRNHELLIQEGVTLVEGLGIIDTIRGVTDGFALSDNGQFLIIEAVLDNGTEGAFLVSLPLFTDDFESGDTSAWTVTVP